MNWLMDIAIMNLATTEFVRLSARFGGLENAVNAADNWISR